MELVTYWHIIWRRFWLVVLIVGVVALYSSYQYYKLYKTPGALKAYSTNMTIQVGLQPTDPQNVSSADMVTVSETLADALANGPIFSSTAFDNQVVTQIQSDSGEIAQKFGANPDLGDIQNTGAIGSSITAIHVHSLVTVTVNWATAPGAWAINTAIGEVLSNNTCTFLNYDIPQGSTCSSVSSTSGQPVVTAKVISSASDPGLVPGASANKVTLLIILILVALIVAIALAFLLDYLDDRIRGKDDAAHLLHLPVYGTIPRTPTPGTRKAQP